MLRTVGGAVVKFVHFKPDELAVAERWVKQTNLDGSITWDVKLSRDPGRSPANAPASQAELFAFLQQFRIDAVVETDKEVWLVEFKDRVRMSGLGQLITYAALYREQYKPTKPVRMLMVAGQNDPQIAIVGNAQGIGVEVV